MIIRAVDVVFLFKDGIVGGTGQERMDLMACSSIKQETRALERERKRDKAKS